MEEFKIELKLKELQIQGFRPFEEKILLPFQPDITVIVGNNASGKTSILDVLANLLKAVPNMLNNNRLDQHVLLGAEDINYNIKPRESVSQLSLIAAYPEVNFEEEEELINQEEEISFELRLNPSQSVREQKIRLTSSNGDTALGDSYPIFQRAKAEKKKVSLPILAYYAARRLDRAVDSQKGNILNIDVFANFKNDELSQDSFDLDRLRSWLNYLEQRQLKQQYETEEEKEREEEVWKNIQQVVIDFLSGNGVVYEGVETIYNTKYPNGTLAVKTNKGSRSIQQLSSGEKNILLLVIDIARQLAIANPDAKNPLEEGTGIVLIDEVDLHLHPAWQEQLFDKLKKCFPKLQFVVSTHSPHVVRHLKKENLVIIEQEEDGPLLLQVGEKYIEERSVELILAEVFKISLEGKYDAKVRNFYDLLAEGDLEKAKERLSELEEFWGEDDQQIKATTAAYDLEVKWLEDDEEE